MILNIFIIFISSVYLSCQQNTDFKVTQNQMVNPDGSAFISCEHNANSSSIMDVRLNSVLQRKRTPLCKKGMQHCSDIIMFLHSPNKCLFIIVKIGPEATNVQYECEFTVEINNLHSTRRGIPTRLVPSTSEGQKETPLPPPSPSPSPPPPPLKHFDLSWILIGLLALVFLYSCVITCVLVRLRMNTGFDPEDCTYVEMRNGPLQMK
ncbi:uncharacterized protein [Paralichthys olivaceus]|uniref:uncharacterized protein n=1 Tax=Paralichthys olivaceus TaxID=8255 RepID=UPI00375127A8